MIDTQQAGVPLQTLSKSPGAVHLKNMSFSEALLHLKHGQKIKRAAWGGYWFLGKNVYCQCPSSAGGGYVTGFSFNNGLIVAILRDSGGCAPAQPYQADILAEDWEVIDFNPSLRL